LLAPEGRLKQESPHLWAQRSVMGIISSNSIDYRSIGGTK
jgi:hypothetical protein